MSTTTSTASAKSSSRTSIGSSLAASARFRTFAIVFSITAPIVYVACELFSLPLFTYHPATNRFDLGWAAGRSGEGPAMYWYGWTATMLIACTILGALATLLPQRITKKIPLALIWILPLAAMAPLAWALMPFWTKE
ncbi:MAG: hypothetical protein IT536_08875 [Hyphomicrobiales bacterium]|nr:hypothetical protein [Hyphomicrobiales bacterium]